MNRVIPHHIIIKIMKMPKRNVKRSFNLTTNYVVFPYSFNPSVSRLGNVLVIL